MKTRTRKQREIHRREEDILNVAREMLATRGYLGFNMDRIAEALEYSKGTIYQHFSCKEEVLMALIIQSSEKRSTMFAEAAKFNGRTRERITAIGCAAERFVRQYPDHFRVEQVLQLNSIWEKTSPERQKLLLGCQTQCMSIVVDVVRDAIACRDLTLREDMTPEDLVFGMWSLSFGAYSIMSTSGPLAELGIVDPFTSTSTNMQLMLDGFGWKPKLAQWDYNATVQRIQQERFADEPLRTVTKSSQGAMS